MIRARMNEENEATMTRFLNGLNHDIRDVVELEEYVDMEDLLQKTLVADHSNHINFLPNVDSLLQKFKDVFSNEIPIGLPPLRGIEHHIDLLPRASLPNR